MAFPTVQSITTTNFASDATAHLVNMPATVNAGDLLLCIFACDALPSVTTPSGWTSINSYSFSNRTAIFAKIASGSEGGTTVDFVTSASEAATAQVYRITGVSGGVTSSDITSAHATGTGSNPDPPNLDPSGWGTLDTLWIAVASCSDPVSGVTTYPTNYTNGTYSQSGSGTTHVQLASARRENNTAAENPGTYTLNASAGNGWSGITIAIRPGVSTFNMAASVAVSFNGTVSLTRQYRLIGTQNITFAGSVSIVRALNMLGSAEATFSGLAELRGGTTLMEGSAALSFSGSVALRAQYNMVADISVTFSGSAALTRQYNIHGAADTLFMAGSITFNERFNMRGTSAITFAGEANFRSDQAWNKVIPNTTGFTRVTPNDGDFVIVTPNPDNTWVKQ